MTILNWKKYFHDYYHHFDVRNYVFVAIVVASIVDFVAFAVVDVVTFVVVVDLVVVAVSAVLVVVVIVIVVNELKREYSKI